MFDGLPSSKKIPVSVFQLAKKFSGNPARVQENHRIFQFAKQFASNTPICRGARVPTACEKSRVQFRDVNEACNEFSGTSKREYLDAAKDIVGLFGMPEKYHLNFLDGSATSPLQPEVRNSQSFYV